MKPQPGIWNTLTRIVIILIVVAGVLAIGSRYVPLIQQNERMRRQLNELEAQKAAEQEIARQLKSRTELLMQNPDALEREVRAQLGLARPGETVIQFYTPAVGR